MKKYSVSFKYLDFKSSGRKYINADSEEEAIDEFNELYKDYNVEITGVNEIGKNEESKRNV